MASHTPNHQITLNQSAMINNYSDLFRRSDYVSSFNQKNFRWKNENDIFLIYFNIRSLQKHIDTLNNFLANFKNQPDIIAISETRLREGKITKKNIELEGYKFICKNSESSAGGVRLYIKNEIIFNLNPCSKKTLLNSEHLWIDIQTTNGSVVIGVIYRHPTTDIDNFSKGLN